MKGKIFMKKRLLFLLLMSCILFVTGCENSNKDIVNDELDFIETSYKRTEDLNISFNMDYAETKDYAIGFLSGLLSEDELLSYARQLSDDIDILDGVCDPKDKEMVYIYVLDKDRISKSYAIDNKAYISIEDIKSDTYKLILTQAYLGVSEPWTIYGTYGLAFLDSIDIDVLKEYYMSADNFSLLGLFGGRFFDLWNTEEELEISRKTAVALCDFVLDKYDLNTLKNEVNKDIKQEWLNFIGVDREYNYIYEGEFVDFTYDATDEYPIIITTDSVTYHMLPTEWGPSNTDDIEEFLYYDIQGRKDIIDYLIENAGDMLDMINIDVYNNLYIYYDRSFSPDGVGAYADSHNNIHLFTDISAHLHEFCHILIPNNFLSSYWQYEAISEYLSRIVANRGYSSYYQDLLLMSDLLDDPETTDILGDSKESWEYFFEFFYDKGGSLASLELFDIKAFYDACALTSKKYDNWYIFSAHLTVGEVYDIKEEDIREGDELTYFQATSFMSYLIDNYSVSQALMLCDGVDFEDAFGISYTHAMRDWEVSLGLENK